MDKFDEIIHDPGIRLDMMMEPGDMLVAHNYPVMQSRTSFEVPERHRKLLDQAAMLPAIYRKATTTRKQTTCCIRYIQ